MFGPTEGEGKQELRQGRKKDNEERKGREGGREVGSLGLRVFKQLKEKD